MIREGGERISLLRGGKRRGNGRGWRSFSMTIFLFLVVVSFYNLGTIVGNSNSKNKNHKKNVIFFVTDGMGPASLSLTRSYRQYVEQLEIDDILELDKHLIGSSRTRSANSLVTDSSAGATAFACAMKTYNSGTGVGPDKSPCGTLLEAAKLKGYMTGLVVTTRITDATPASFSSHVDYRFQEDQIAEHQMGEYPLGRMVDLMMGGGRTHFYPSGLEDPRYGNRGLRQDDRNLIQEAIDNGWQYAGNREDFDQLQMGKNISLPLLGLFADFDIPFDIDRSDSEYPSLEEQTITALTALDDATKHSKEGFFIMIEGSRIDHAGHQNDPAAQVREVLAFDKAFQAALDFAKNSDTETIIISTSDHETGGLVTSRQVTVSYPEYVWYPEVLFNAKHSGEYLKKLIVNYNKEDKRDFIRKEILENQLNIGDYSDEEVDMLVNMTDMEEIGYKLNDMVSFRAQIGWTTHGHSAVDVNIYAYSNRRKSWFEILDHLQGNHENIEIGKFMRDYMKLDLEEVTKRIKDTDHSPRKKDTQQLDAYHHLAFQ
ncbi:Repressible alkaline phosphatase [Nakaseomyces bracarensis]|uniref:Alkaline phosphatase n=1 Tax=Nakaseomyces bracarensis TaxID=273131 RepID=A0ABR4NYK7_9SACH